jgi:uncharacterized phage-like protein YoqJ
MITVAGTGHRPDRLGLGYDAKSEELLTDFAAIQLGKLRLSAPLNRVISGFAQGWDQALARAAICLDIPVTAAIPFAGQEAKWPAVAQADYQRLLEKCERVVVVSEGPYAAWKFTKRDEFMVDNAHHILALYDEKGNSGTGITVAYAATKEKSVTNLWKAWQLFRTTTF